MSSLLDARPFPPRPAVTTIVGIGAGLAMLAGLLGFGLMLPAVFVAQSLAAFAVIALMVLIYLPPACGAGLGSANSVTLARAALVALLIGFVGHAEYSAGNENLLAAIAVIALALDGVDGWLARRRGVASAFGARFDMETDALLIAVLAALVWQASKAGVWVLLAGTLRYLFVAAGKFLPWLRSALPASRRRQTVCVAQVVILVGCLPSFVPVGGSMLIAVGGLVLLMTSFAVDILWLARHAR